jgi:putative glutamine amidotransferase
MTLGNRRRLRIGVSACFFHADPTRPIFKGKTLLYAEQSLLKALSNRGAIPYLVPEPSDGVSLGELARDLDGLVLPGGSDVDPVSYGARSLRPESPGDAHRDQYEMSLFHAFMTHEKPVFGICRGAQLMNVARGGTLHQDLATELPRARRHRDWESYDQNFHEVELIRGGVLDELLGTQRARRINTIHRQAIDELGEGVRIEARCPEDGVIEAISIEGPVFAVGVQWHPEFHDPKDSSLLHWEPLIQEFLREAARTRGRETC